MGGGWDIESYGQRPQQVFINTRERVRTLPFIKQGAVFYVKLFPAFKEISIF